MFWGPQELQDIITYPIEGTAEELGSEIEFIAKYQIKNKEVPEEIRNNFLENDFDYVPIRPWHNPDKKYYDVKEDKLKDIRKDQLVWFDQEIIRVLNILTEYPFAFVGHPDASCYKIITPSDFNSKFSKEYFYSYFSELARNIAMFLKTKYKSKELKKIYQESRNKPYALKRWKKAKGNNVNLHLAEFMDLTDFKEVIKNEETMRETLGFSSKTKCEKAFKPIDKFRNRVMHANRSLIHQEDDVEKLAKVIDTNVNLNNKIKEILNNID